MHPFVGAHLFGTRRWLGFWAWCVLSLLGGIPFGWARDPGDEALLAKRFLRLGRTHAWRRAAVIPLDFNAFHPQGLARVGETFFLSSVEVINRARDEGRGHLFEIDARGHLLRSVRLDSGAMYHPGGLDYDGHSLWVPVAEYRPDSHSRVYRVSPVDLSVEQAFEFPDHLGAVVCFGRRLWGVSWGSRRSYVWDRPQKNGRRPTPRSVVATNGNHYIDYQDGQSLGGSGLAVMGGLATYTGPGETRFALGGLELVDLRSRRAVHQIPVPLWTDRGRCMTQNPFHMELHERGLRFWFLPEDGRGQFCVFDVE